MKYDQNTRKSKLLIWEVVFSLCFDDMSHEMLSEHTENNTLYLETCFLYVLITCLNEMLAEHKENTTFQIQRVRNLCNHNVLYRNVIRTNGKQDLPTPKCPNLLLVDLRLRDTGELSVRDRPVTVLVELGHQSVELVLLDFHAHLVCVGVWGRKDLNAEYRIVENTLFERLTAALVGQPVSGGPDLQKGDVLTAEYLAALPRADWFKLRMQDEAMAAQLESAESRLKERKVDQEARFDDKKRKLQSGDDLQPGVLKVVKVYLAVKRYIQPGDKMAGRHGNKGVISVIMPVEDMPYDAKGNPVDIVLNPLGVPSRMNVGQILETHLGAAAKGLGDQINEMMLEQRSAGDLRDFMDQIYNHSGTGHRTETLGEFSDAEIMELAGNLRGGVPIATPVFDGAKEEEVKGLLRLAGMDDSGQIQLWDGRTGDLFENKTTVGYMYMLG